MCQQEGVGGDGRFGLKRDFCEATKKRLSLIIVGPARRSAAKRERQQGWFWLWLPQFVHIPSTSTSRRINLVFLPSYWSNFSHSCYGCHSLSSCSSPFHLPSTRDGDVSTHDIYLSPSLQQGHLFYLLPSAAAVIPPWTNTSHQPPSMTAMWNRRLKKKKKIEERRGKIFTRERGKGLRDELEIAWLELEGRDRKGGRDRERTK